MLADDLDELVGVVSRFDLPDGKPCFSNLNGTFSAQFTGLVGTNGSGKSTLAKVLGLQAL